VSVAFVIAVFLGMIVGRRVATSTSDGLVLAALEQALLARRKTGRLIHHGDRGSQYLSIASCEHLDEAGIEASVGRVGDDNDNALTETVKGFIRGRSDP